MKRTVSLLLLLILFVGFLPDDVRARTREVEERSAIFPEKNQNCHEMTEKWFSNCSLHLMDAPEKNIEEVIQRWFSLRESDFPGALVLLSSDDFSLSEQTMLDHELREDGIAFMQNFLGIELLDADVTARIVEDSVDYHEDGRITLYVYEWTFFDYDDLSDVEKTSDIAGYGTYHKITLLADENSCSILSDEYDESDITGISTLSEETRDEMIALGYLSRSEQSELNNKDCATVALMSYNYYSSYDTNAVIAYADKWAINYNPEYKSYKWDCANYVSQCISAGGMPHVSGSSGWYCNSSSSSDSWRFGATLKNWMANNRGNKVSVNTSNCKSTVFPGSPIFQDQHATICVGYNSAGTPIWNAHTNDRYHMLFNSLFDYTVQLTPDSNSGTVLPSAPDMPSVAVSENTVTVSWTGVENAKYYDVYLVQSPWGWKDIKFSSGAVYQTTYTFSDVPKGAYSAFVVSRPNDNTVQSSWCSFEVHVPLSGTIIYLNAAGGICSPSWFVIHYGDCWTLPVPEREGYKFGGWFSEQNGNGSQYTNEGRFWGASDEQTVFANWIGVGKTSVEIPAGMTVVSQRQIDGENTFRGVNELIVYSSVGSTVLTNPYGIEIAVDAKGAISSVREYGSDEQLVVPENGFVLSGHIQDWYAGGAFLSEIKNMDDARVVVDYDNNQVLVYGYAEPETYIIEYNANGGMDTPPAQEKRKGEDLTIMINRPTRNGFIFLGWAENASATVVQYLPGDSFTKDANTTLYAVWEEDEHFVTSVALSKSTIFLIAGATETLTATVSPSNATNKAVAWTTSNVSVATVSASGTVTAVGAGMATITATTVDGGKTASCAVTVSEESVDPDAPVVRVGEATVTSGGTFSVPVEFLNNPGITGFSLELSYDLNYLELTSVADGDFTGLTKSKEITENPYVIVWNHGTADQIGTTAATLTFHAKDGVEGTTQIQVALRNGEKPWNVMDENIPFTAKSGTVTIRNSTPGDANSDGVVSGRDATRVVQYVAGWDVTINMNSADANSDGVVSGRDATRIVQYVAGWNVKLGQTAPKLMSLLGSVPNNQLLVVGNGTAVPGDTVTIPITFQSNPGITGFSIAIDYDDAALELIAARSGDFDGLTLSPTIDTKPYCVVWNHGTVDMTGSIAVELDFRVKSGASGSTTVSCSYISGEKPWNVSDDEVDFKLVNGTVTVGSAAAALNVIGISGTTMTWSTNLNGAGKTLTAIAAWYDANGGLIGTSAKPVTVNGSIGNQTINIEANAAEYRLFLLDGNSRPVAKSWKSK